MHEIPLTTIRGCSNIEDVSFYFDKSSFDITKRVETFASKDNIFKNDKSFNKENIVEPSAKAKKYITEPDEELLTFSAFNDNSISFTFDDGDTTLIIQEYKSGHAASDDHLMRLEGLAYRLSHFNSLRTEKAPSLWDKVYLNLSGVFNPIKKEPRHLRITKVIVSLSGCEAVTDKGIKLLVNFLKNFKNLQSLELEVKNTEVTDDSICFVSSLLTILGRLSCFYIDFCGCKISEAGIFVLANALNSKRDMKEIWLRFSWSQPNRIKNEGILALCRALEQFHSLEVLLLEFNGHSDITSKGLSGVLSAIKEHSSMRKLFLYFENAQVSDNFLAYAGEVLPNLKGLKVFGLNLANSNYISAKGVEKLEKALISLKGLRVGLYIYLKGCLGIRENERVRQSLESLVKKRKVQNHVLEFA